MGFQNVPGSYIAKGLLCDNGAQIFNEETRQYSSLAELNTLITIFDKQVVERIFKPAEILLSYGNEYLIPAVSLALSYVEYSGQLRNGTSSEGNSRRTFTVRFQEIFTNVRDGDADRVYKDLRSGFAHVAMMRNGFLVMHDEAEDAEPIEHDSGRKLFVINPRAFVSCLQNAHTNYINDLRLPSNGGPEADIVRNFRKIYCALIQFEQRV